MGLTLDRVVPWGRSLGEYRRMFALDDGDRCRRILGCADGPASFNAEWTADGGRVVSADPLYAFSAREIRRRIDETHEEIGQKVRLHRDDYCWTDIVDPAALCRRRMAAMKHFLDDYEQNGEGGRYVAASLPHLPFADDTFDLALCSHYLFTYSDHVSEDLHVAGIRTMLRVAPEARVFPLLQTDGVPSPHVAPVTARLRREGFHVEVRRVRYEFQRGGNEMLVVSRG